MADVQFARADMKKGKKFQQVAGMIEQILENSGQPVKFQDMCDNAGAKYPQDVQAAMFALELAGVCDRYTYTEPGSTRVLDAYGLSEEYMGALTRMNTGG